MMSEGTMDKAMFAAKVVEIVATLNAKADELRAAGKSPLYPAFEFTMGPKHARIFATFPNSDSRSARMFIGIDGLVRRADSWKQPGRVLCSVEQLANAYAYGLGPIGTARKPVVSAQESFLASIGAA